MLDIDALHRAAAAALASVERQPDVAEVEVFVSANGLQTARVHYTSHLPCNGVEEPKSTDNVGVGLTVVFRGAPDAPVRVGFGAESGDVGPDAVAAALDKAREGAVADPEFYSLPDPGGPPALRRYHDPALMDLHDADLVDVGWREVTAALETFQRSEDLDAAAAGRSRRDMGLILGGDVTIVQERMAIASSRMREVQQDETALLVSRLTAMVEAEESKGSGYDAVTRLADFHGAAGREAASASIAQIGGVRVQSGDYPVLFGRQAVADLLHYLVVPGLEASTFSMQSSPFQGQAGQRVLDPALSLYDDGALPGAVGSKRLTCEGLPTGRTPLIDRGRLVGLLSNWYETQRLLRDADGTEKLGQSPAAFAAGLVPRNGFRFSPGGGRQHSMQPGISPTNLVVESDAPVPREELLGRIGNGLYLGRLWYTYPINGARAADFTSTVVGDSFVIRNGCLAEPLRANSLRLNDNILRVFRQVLGVGDRTYPTTVWAADEITHAREIACARVHCEAIAGTALTLV